MLDQRAEKTALKLNESFKKEVIKWRETTGENLALHQYK